MLSDAFVLCVGLFRSACKYVFLYSFWELSRRSISSPPTQHFLCNLANVFLSTLNRRLANAITLQNVFFFSLFLSFQEDQDWGFVAMVLDRLFLWLFTTASLFGTFSILCEAPALWVFFLLMNVTPLRARKIFNERYFPFLSCRQQIRWHSANWHPILNNRSEVIQYNC